jgi:hypothetical protein
MTLIAFSGDQPRARKVYAGGQFLATFISTGTDCCNECPPCCPCSDISIPEPCGEIQSIIAELDFGQAGTCDIPGPLTVTLTAADEDNGFPFSKTTAFSLGNGATATVNVALACDGAIYCRALFVQLSVSGCSFCNGNVQFVGLVHRLNRLPNANAQDAECCPTGAESAHSIPFCNDFSLTITSTFVY